MSEATHIRYEVTIRTDCKACAMALAGQSPAAAKVRAVFVHAQGVDVDGVWVGERTTLHNNAPMFKTHDGSPMFCIEHGKVVDLSKPHPDSAS